MKSTKNKLRGEDTVLLSWAGLRIPKETLAHELHTFWVKKKIMKRKGSSVKLKRFVVGEAQTLSNVAL